MRYLFKLKTKNCQFLAVRSFALTSGLGEKNKLANYSKTIILPATQFPLRVNPQKRPEHDSWIHKEAGFDSLYQWQSRERTDKESYILHDGPPYANGKPHMGHALNKILKDITNRFHLLQGKQIHYVPGWDCHGLPIELKATGLGSAGRMGNADPLKTRAKARNFALEAIDKQKAEFERWGVMADWENACYRTFEVSYVVEQLQAFKTLHEKGLVYRDYKPVYWSPSSRTALAEAELEYNPSHCSTSTYVRFPVTESSLPDILKPHASSNTVSLLVWTTTPWTLPANQAVCYSPDKKYSLVSTAASRDEQKLIVASELKTTLEQTFQMKLETLTEFDGAALKDLKYKNPLYENQEHPMIPADHVTMTKGTGLVHTAPAHGPEDFVAALKHGIHAVCLVDEAGCYTEAAGPTLAGQSVLEQGQDTVLQLLGSRVVLKESFQHSYPYDWRTKLPVILRASLQWFINTDKLKSNALEAMKDVRVIPSNQESSMLNQLAKRPFWCISRQRVWGVPIPVFYTGEDSNTVLVNKDTINRLCGLIKDQGTDVWWKRTAEELLGPELIEKYRVDTTTLRKGADIFDIWFDSGMSWKCVLPDKAQADLYLEGIDQFGGWFQSSLLTSVALTGKAPYKKIFVHGFALDDKGQKMSKSLGNVIDPHDITDGTKNQPAMGADVLRWWTASHVTGNASNVPISASLLKQVAEDVQKIRSVLRFLLGVLNNVNPSDLSELDVDHFAEIDKFALHSLAGFVDNVITAYSEMNYKKVTILVGNFVTNQISSFYCNLVKDRLYCHPARSPERLAAVFVVDQFLKNLVLSIAPIVPHLAEEVALFRHSQPGSGGVFRITQLQSLGEFRNPEVADMMEKVLSVRDAVNQLLASANTKEWSVHVEANPAFYNILKKFQVENSSLFSPLCELFQVSQVTLSLRETGEHEETVTAAEEKSMVIDNGGPVRILVQKSSFSPCPRCRRFTAKSNELCLFCAEVVASLPSV